MKESSIALYFTICFILLANGYSLFFDFLYQDDKALYLEALHNLKPNYGRSLFGAYYNHIFAEISTFSIYLARFILIGFMILCARLLSKIYNSYLGLNKEVALFASILPFICPEQVSFPLFVNGSYSLSYLLITTIIFLFGIKISEKKEQIDVKAILFFALIVYLSIFSNSNPFFFVPFVFIYLFNTNLNFKHKIACIAIIVLNTIGGVFKILNTPIPIQKVQNFSFQVIFDRIVQSFDFVSPFTFNTNKINFYIGIVAISITIFSMLFTFLKDKKDLTKLAFLLFASSWMVVNLVPFLIAPFFPSRYLFVFGIGFSLVFCQALFIILRKIRFTKSVELFTILIVIICCYSTYQKIANTKKFIATEWRTQMNLDKTISSQNFPKNSQFIFSLPAYKHSSAGGWWKWSTGTIQHISKREDLVGLIGVEKKFYDPFIIGNRYYRRSDKMNGLNINKPLFIFNYNTKSFAQINHILKYTKGSKNWQLYKTDKQTGNISLLKSGNGDNKGELKNFIELQNINSSTIYGY